MPKFEGQVSLKRKKYWVTRWIEVTSSTIQYRNTKDDQIKRQYTLSNCKIQMEQENKTLIVKSANERLEIKLDSIQQYEQIYETLYTSYYDDYPQTNKQTQEQGEQQMMLAYNRNQQEINFWKQIDADENKRNFLQYYDDTKYAREKFEALLIEQVSFFNLHEKFKYFMEIILVEGETTLQTGGEAIINCDKKQILDIITKKSNYDNFIAEESVVKELNQELKIVQNTLKLAFPNQNRQFILLRRLYEENQSIVLVEKSSENVDGLQNINTLFNSLILGWKVRGFANGTTLVSFASQIQFKCLLDQNKTMVKNYIYEQKYSQEQAQWLPKMAEFVKE